MLHVAVVALLIVLVIYLTRVHTTDVAIDLIAFRPVCRESKCPAILEIRSKDGAVFPSDATHARLVSFSGDARLTEAMQRLPLAGQVLANGRVFASNTLPAGLGDGFMFANGTGVLRLAKARE
jgi:hypothetical protein